MLKLKLILTMPDAYTFIFAMQCNLNKKNGGLHH